MFKKLLSTIIFLGVIAGAGVYFYNSQPCVQPISYRIGEFDPRFNIGRADFAKVVEQAGEIWGEDMGRDLFKFEANGNLVVNLIYDERQETADKNAKIISNIEQTTQSADMVQAQFLALELEYQSNLAEYNLLLAKRKNFEAIEAKRRQVNALAEEINALIKKYNFLVSTVNTNISTVNQTAGQEFEEGEYVYDQDGQRINIYEFKTRTELVRVLAHEFGHALGLDHNDNPKSIMYYLNQSTNEALTPEDSGSLQAVCSPLLKYEKLDRIRYL